MITLHYVGAHKGGTPTAAMGDWVIRWAQRGYSLPARTVTHTEVFLGGTWDNATIASSSIIDDDGDGRGGVRIKHGVRLNPAHWIVLDLPDTETRSAFVAARWFKQHDGQPYDVLGAPGSVAGALLGHRLSGWFCSESVACAMGFKDPHMLCPAAFYTLLIAMGARDVTSEFFGVSDK
jgi:hypothetical protein